MKNNQQEFLNQVHDVVAKAKKADIDAYEVDARVEIGFEVSARMGDAENLEHHRSKGLTLTVYKDQRTGSASTSDFSKKALQETLNKAVAMAQYAEPDSFSGLADKALLAYQYSDLALFHEWNLPPQEALKLAIRCDEVARQDARIRQTEEAAVYSSHCFRAYANSHDFFGEYASSFHGLSISVVAESDGSMERDYEACYSRRAEELESPETIAKRAVDRTVKRLGARKISSRRCPVIFERRMARSLLGNFIAAISGRNLYRHQSFLQDSLGKAIFPEHITICQRPHILSGYGSAPFDGEGVLTKELDYVAEGIVTNYVLGSYSARKLNLTSTGNASGVCNLFISTSDLNLAQLCEEIKTGFLVTELLGQGVNLLTGDYSRGAAGFWVENGKIQYPVHEVTISGNLRDMFAGIMAVGNDTDPRSNIVTGSIALREMVVAGE